MSQQKKKFVNFVKNSEKFWRICRRENYEYFRKKISNILKLFIKQIPTPNWQYIRLKYGVP